MTWREILEIVGFGIFVSLTVYGTAIVVLSM